MVQTALVFPGQGPQSASMLDDHLKDPFFARYYPLLCDLTGSKVRERMAAEPDWLRRNEIASLLTIFTNALGLEGLRQTDVAFQAAAGYSVGQWSALSVAGACDFEQLVRLVWKRSQLMNDTRAATEGAMLAVIGLATAVVSDACAQASSGDSRVVISNFNCTGQLTLAGTRDAVARAIPLLEAHKPRKMLEVPVSGAWHCYLLEPAARGFRAFLDGVSLEPLSLPVADNVTGGLLPRSGEALKDRLAEHIASPVRWESCVKTLRDEGARRFVEVGFGNMLTKFGFFIDRECQHLTQAQVQVPH